MTHQFIPQQPRLYTIGHSNLTSEEFLELLRSHEIAAVADVRSSPYSRFAPHFNREPLAEALWRAGIRYVFLGEELGARRSEPECYRDGKARYELIATCPSFRQGLARVAKGVEKFRLALMCAEKDPLTCHRTILVCRHLRGECGPIAHVHEDGGLESHDDAEARLLRLCRLKPIDLFQTRDELVESAYDIQGDRIAYTTSAVPAGEEAE